MTVKFPTALTMLYITIDVSPTAVTVNSITALTTRLAKDPKEAQTFAWMEIS